MFDLHVVATGGTWGMVVRATKVEQTTNITSKGPGSDRSHHHSGRGRNNLYRVYGNEETIREKIKKNRAEVVWVKGGVVLMFGAVNEVRDVYFFYYEGVMIL